MRERRGAGARVPAAPRGPGQAGVRAARGGGGGGGCSADTGRGAPSSASTAGEGERSRRRSAGSSHPGIYRPPPTPRSLRRCPAALAEPSRARSPVRGPGKGRSASPGPGDALPWAPGDVRPGPGTPPRRSPVPGAAARRPARTLPPLGIQRPGRLGGGWEAGVTAALAVLGLHWSGHLLAGGNKEGSGVVFSSVTEPVWAALPPPPHLLRNREGSFAVKGGNVQNH